MLKGTHKRPDTSIAIGKVSVREYVHERRHVHTVYVLPKLDFSVVDLLVCKNGELNGCIRGKHFAGLSGASTLLTADNT